MINTSNSCWMQIKPPTGTADEVQSKEELLEQYKAAVQFKGNFIFMAFIPFSISIIFVIIITILRTLTIYYDNY